ncbi:MAG: hypothetical protein ACOH5I_07085 [Oligoflexus sp.]
MFNFSLKRREIFELKTGNQKITSQNAPLEPILTRLRTNKIIPFVAGKVVLDFGCGSHLKALRAIRNIAKQVFGYDILFKGMPPQTTHDHITIFGISLTFQHL